MGKGIGWSRQAHDRYLVDTGMGRIILCFCLTFIPFANKLMADLHLCNRVYHVSLGMMSLGNNSIPTASVCRHIGLVNIASILQTRI